MIYSSTLQRYKIRKISLNYLSLIFNYIGAIIGSNRSKISSKNPLPGLHHRFNEFQNPHKSLISCGFSFWAYQCAPKNSKVPASKKVRGSRLIFAHFLAVMFCCGALNRSWRKETRSAFGHRRGDKSLATTFGGKGSLINYLTIPFCIIARYYWVGILGRDRYVVAFYNYFVINLQTT